nr:hypothetical protein [Tanacetum cinerariifolium]
RTGPDRVLSSAVGVDWLVRVAAGLGQLLRAITVGAPVRRDRTARHDQPHLCDFCGVAQHQRLPVRAGSVQRHPAGDCLDDHLLLCFSGGHLGRDCRSHAVWRIDRQPSTRSGVRGLSDRCGVNAVGSDCASNLGRIVGTQVAGRGGAPAVASQRLIHGRARVH